MYKYDPERARKAFKNAPKPKSLDKRLGDISYHLNMLRIVMDELNNNIDDLRNEINQ